MVVLDASDNRSNTFTTQKTKKVLVLPRAVCNQVKIIHTLIEFRDWQPYISSLKRTLQPKPDLGKLACIKTQINVFDIIWLKVSMSGQFMKFEEFSTTENIKADFLDVLK